MWQSKSNWWQLFKMNNLTPQDIVALVATAIGAVTDIKTKKIFNWLTFPTAFIGLALNSYLHGLDGAKDAVFGYLVAAFVMMFPDPGKRMHFDDVKMMAAVGAVLGPIKFLIIMFYFSLLYGLVGLFLMFRAIPRNQYKAFWTVFKSLGAGVDLSETVDMTEVKEAGKRKIALGPIILAGTVLGILLDKPTMHFMGFNWC